MATLDAYLQQRQQAIQVIKTKLANSKNKMKQFANKKRSDREFQEWGDGIFKATPEAFKNPISRPYFKVAAKIL